MKKRVVISIIFLAILVSSFGISIVPAEVDSIKQEPTDYLPAEEPLERVYGEDYSWDIWSAISQSSYRDFVRKLTENGSRWIQAPTLYSEQNGEAREYLVDELERISNGRMEVEVIGEYQSVVGKLPGYLPTDGPALLIGGHFDSVPGAPGANDDASGVAAMLEIARVMSEYEWPLDMYFGAWNAEEIGLRGSAEVSREFRNRGVDLLVHYNVDMILMPSSYRTVLMVHPIGPYTVGQYWADLTVQMSNTYGNARMVPVMSSDFSAWQRSDHWSFIQDAYGSSLFAAESSTNDIYYHQPSDTWNNEAYDYAVATEAVRSMGAAFAFIQARAYQMSVHDERSFTLQPSHEKNFYMTMTTDTSVNVTARWYGGAATYSVYDPEGYLVQQVTFDDASPWEPSIVLEVPVTRQGVYQLQVFNHGGTNTGYDVSWVYDTDIDSNGILDKDEFWFDTNRFSTDQDLDTISDADEWIIGTDWQSSDSDSDALPDNWEILYDLDPLNPNDALDDDDGDTLSNLVEFQYNTNPRLLDTDQDTLPDNWEIENGLNPVMDDSSEDPDNDQISNLDEYLAGTDPNVAEPTPVDYLFTPTILTAGIFVIATVSIFVYRRR